MQVVIGIIIWLILCAFISTILTGGSSDAAVSLTLILFFGVPVVLIIYNILKGHSEQNDDKKLEGNFTMKQNHSVTKITYEQPVTIEKTPVLNQDMTTSPTRLGETPVENKVVATNPTRLQKKLKLYNSLFENCQTIDEVISMYVANNDQSIRLKTIEIEMLRHYLQFSSKFKNQTWIGTDLVERINLASNNKSNNDNQSLKGNIFATFVADENLQNSQYKNEQIKKRESSDNSAYALFDKMRKISEEGSFFFSKEDVFIKEGKYMETFTDNYNGYMAFQEYYPTYNSMNDNQLRTYFTWRTKIRNGVLTQTSLSYVFVYIYELINNIGVINSNEGIEKLIWLLKNYQKIENKIKEYLVEWIKDYYICNKFTISFEEIVEQYELDDYYPTVAISANSNKYSFDTLHNIAKYKIEDSKFFTEENKVYIARCFDKVIHNLTPLLALYGIDFDELVSGTSGTLTWWRPFSGAVYRATKGEDKKVIIANNEIYILKDGQWNACKPQQYSNVAALVFGYIIKKIEADLRVLTKYRHKLSPNIGSLLEQIRDSYSVSKRIICVISDTAFEEIIEETTKLEFSALSLNKENTEVPSICKRLSLMLAEEPYLTFVKMRNSDELKGEVDITKRFNIQAKILADLTNDFGAVVPFDSSMPAYEDMSNEQLRCYITWRSKVRNGEYPEIPVSYIRLYVFELINRVGETNSDRIIEKLALILRIYTKLSGNFVSLVTACIKDYYICEDIPRSFYEFLKEHSIEKYYPNVFIEYSTDLDLEEFQQVSNYDITRSKFYSEQTLPIMNDCFKYVFKDVEQYFFDQHLNLKQIIAGKGYAKSWWRPFKNVPCDKEPKSNRRVVICSNEIYSFKDNEWTCELIPEKNNTGTTLIGYMLKRMEVNIRAILKFKYKLTTDVSVIVKRLSNPQISNVVENPAFDKTIDDAVMRYFKEKHPRVFTNPNAPFEQPIEVKIDKSKLRKIREDADIIRDKLTIEEEITEILTVPQPAKEIAVKTPKQFGSPIEELCANLTEIQKNTLIIILNEAPSMPAIMELAQKNKIMPEILLNGINEISLDLISDNLIETAEENPFIYDDYLNEIKMCLEDLDNGKSSS